MTKYVRIKDACEYFQVSKSTFLRWTQEKPGFPQPYKVSARVVLYDLSAIDDFLRGQAAIRGV
jgi:predicted DNA-binding transcriptional regulator AlpA